MKTHSHIYGLNLVAMNGTVFIKLQYSTDSFYQIALESTQYTESMYRNYQKTLFESVWTGSLP